MSEYNDLVTVNKFSEKRKQISTLFSGAKGCGKTTLLMKFVKNYINYGNVCFVYNGAGEEKIEMFPTEKIENFLTTDKKIFKLNYHSGINFFGRLDLATRSKGISKKTLIIFDDGMCFIKLKDFDFENILRSQRQRNLDLIFVTHGISEIPAQFWGFFNSMVLFRTTDNIQRSRNKIPNFDDMEKYVNYVNTNSETNQYYHYYIKL